MNRLCFVGLAVLTVSMAPSAASAAPIALYEVAFNIDGLGYSSISGFQANDLTPASGSPFDVSAFDFTTGLGTIEVRVGGAGAHSVAGFYDLGLTDQTNSAFDDLGAAVGAPGAGQSWEIDEPGFAGYVAPQGDIYTNVFGGALENAGNLVAPDDVSMALAMNFILAADELAVLTFSTTENNPGGFSLRQFDASGAEVFLSSNLRIAQRPIPEPMLSLLTGLAISAGVARRRNRRA